MAAMKTSVGRLYMLFNACLPENEKVKKRLNICKITESTEYNELKNYSPFSAYFSKLFTADKLNSYSVKKLEEIARAIPKIIPLIEKICDAIMYGNASELRAKDTPDFTSPKSIDALMARLKIDSASSNLTNIDEDNFMEIFSDRTVKDPTIAIKSIKVSDVDRLVETVRRELTGKIYCIRERDVRKLQADLRNKVSDAKLKLADIKAEKWKLRRKKLLFIAIAIVILAAINSFEILSQGGAAALDLTSAMLIILYFFIG